MRTLAANATRVPASPSMMLAKRPALKQLLAGTCPAIALAVGVLVGAGCGGDTILVLDVAGQQSGELGEPGPYGVGWIERPLRVRPDASVETDIYVPLTADKTVAPGPFPPVVGIQGGLVDQAAYRWLYVHIASRGFVVIAPHHPGRVAIFSVGNAAGALRAIRRLSAQSSGRLQDVIAADRRALVLGHSLGGVVAAKNWLYEPENFSHLALLASYPAAFETYERSPDPNGDAALSIIGSRDARTEDPVRKAKEGVDRLEQPTTFAIVEGMNHYQWGDLPRSGELRQDASPNIDTPLARARALVLLDAFLQTYRGGEDIALLRSPSEWPRGVVPWDAWQESEP